MLLLTYLPIPDEYHDAKRGGEVAKANCSSGFIIQHSSLI